MDSLSKLAKNIEKPKVLTEAELAEFFAAKEKVQARTKVQREKDRALIMELSHKKLTAAEMIRHPELCHLSLPTIHSDLKALEKRFKKYQTKEQKEKKKEDLAVLDLLEKEAWQEWERSKKDKQKKVSKTGFNDKGATEEEQLIEEGRTGDPRYLEMVLKAISERNKMLGNYAPAKQEHSGALDLRAISINYHKPVVTENKESLSD